MAESNAGLFTPRDAVTDERYRLQLSPANMAQIGRGPHWRALVTDLKTGKRYAAQGAPCNAACYCDAVAIELPADASRA